MAMIMTMLMMIQFDYCVTEMGWFFRAGKRRETCSSFVMNIKFENSSRAFKILIFRNIYSRVDGATLTYVFSGLAREFVSRVVWCYPCAIGGFPFYKFSQAAKLND